MIYLDYSATTMVNDEVLETFNKVSKEYIGNTNSLHSLGMESRKLLDLSVLKVADFFKIMKNEIIFTSGSTESNNLAIKGVCEFYKNRGKHIISSKLEHSSVIETLKKMELKGYEISYVNVLPSGLIDINNLKSLIRKDTVLISLAMVDSEIGVLQDVNNIGKIIKDINDKTIFHVDATQAIGKVDVNFENIDLLSMSAHKFYGLKGIGMLYKNNTISLNNLLDGGKSQSIYRAGTPPLALIVSFVKALNLVYKDFENKKNHIKKLNERVINHISKYDNVFINSSSNSINNIINFSIINVKPETFLHALSSYDIFISTKSACSSSSSMSESVFAITKDKKRADTSLRISISFKTTDLEIDKFLEIFDCEYKKLSLSMGD